MDQQKTVCKIAFVNLDESTAAVLSDAFKRFRIQAVNVTVKENHRLGDERFDACVLPLLPGCEPIIEGIRKSRRDKGIMIYGIAAPEQNIQQVSKLGINVLLNLPVDHQTAMRVVRGSHLLVLHEFRRYTRVPMITEVRLNLGSLPFERVSLELSRGGMSLESSPHLKVGDTVETVFTLPANETFSCRARVSWMKSDRTGIRFDPSDKRLQRLMRWLDRYLDI